MASSSSQGNPPNFAETKEIPPTPTTTVGQNSSDGSEFKRDFGFWMVFVSLCCCTLLSALDLGGIGTAAPTIVHKLNGSDFTWVASAYALSSAAFVPLSGNFAQIFGRRPVILSGIVMFAVGSAICGTAHTLDILILGRALQGVGAGAMQALSSIIITDLVPLRERGAYAGITGMIWTVGSAAGPFVAGGLSQDVTWRWLFYLNLPLSGLAFAVVAFFLHLKKPGGNFREKLAKIDWVGNIIIVASTSSSMLALTWGGVHFAWSSAKILAPLIIGIVGLVSAGIYDILWAKHPVIPFTVLSNRTTVAGYVATFVQGMVTLSMSFFLPTWFQSVKVASPILSGLYLLPLCVVISPAAIAQGLIIARTGYYRAVNFVGWMLLLVGVGLLISIRQDTSIGLLAFYQLIMGLGMGFLYSIMFAILGPLPLEANAPAVAFSNFLRLFSQAWGIAIGGTILQNELVKTLPKAVFSGNPSGNGQLVYAVIPLIPTLSPAVKAEVQLAFLSSLRRVWVAFEICTAVGFLSFFVMKNYPLQKKVDGKWGIDRDRKARPVKSSA